VIHFFGTHVILIQKVSIFLAFVDMIVRCLLGLQDEDICYIHEFNLFGIKRTKSLVDRA
jgi:hypothetical protein